MLEVNSQDQNQLGEAMCQFFGSVLSIGSGKTWTELLNAGGAVNEHVRDG